jgi:hypothetical protein
MRDTHRACVTLLAALDVHPRVAMQFKHVNALGILGIHGIYRARDLSNLALA